MTTMSSHEARTCTSKVPYDGEEAVFSGSVICKQAALSCTDGAGIHCLSPRAVSLTASSRPNRSGTLLPPVRYSAEVALLNDAPITHRSSRKKKRMLIFDSDLFRSTGINQLPNPPSLPSGP